MKPLHSALIIAGLALSACAGGGGGGGGFAAPVVTTTDTVPPPQPIPFNAPAGTPFTAWAATPAPGAYALSGAGMTVAKPNFTSHDWGSAMPSDQIVSLSFTSAGDLDQAWIDQGQNTLFKVAAQNPFTRSDNAIGLGTGSLVMKTLVFGDADTYPLTPFTYADPVSSGFSYQTFGWWLMSQGGARTQQYGAYSAGAPTPGAAIPTGGTASFSGALSAEGVDTGFTSVAAPVTLNVDFAGRSAAFSSSNFRDAQGTVYGGTALTGTLTYAGQTNALSGQLTSTAYAGPANGRFYGPAAQEIGGSFVLTPTDPNGFGRVVGGFGAKR